jgi:RNA polymerase sigma factor (sigma-70 family)
MRGCEQVDQLIDIEAALQALTVKQRNAVTLAMQGYSQCDIARILGVNQSSIHRRLRTARNCIKNASHWLVGSE